MTSAVLSTFSDVVSFLAQSFKLAAVIPAFAFAFLHELVIFPHLPQRGLIGQVADLDVSGKAIVAGVFSLLIGYTLTIINVPLVRIFEGYPWRWTFFGRLLTDCQQARLEKLEKANTAGAVQLRKAIAQLKEEARAYEVGHPRRERIYKEWETLEEILGQEERLCADERREYMPSNPAELLPTGLGNTIRAFEDYSWARYGVDAVVLWPRLLPTLTNENYASYVEREKAGFDFPLNMSFLLGVLAFEVAYVGLIYGESYLPWLCGAALSVFLSFVFYKVSISGAFNWGITVRVAFDLYRYKLLKALGGRAPKRFQDEVARWKQMSLFLREGKESDHPLTERQLTQLIDYPGIGRDFEDQRPAQNGDNGGDE
jgi:hypothetical protein